MAHPTSQISRVERLVKQGDQAHPIHASGITVPHHLPTSSILRKLDKLALRLISKRLDFFHQSVLRGLTITGLLDILLENFDVFRLEQLYQCIKFGELFLNDRGGWGGTFRLEVVARSDHTGDRLDVNNNLLSDEWLYSPSSTF